MSCLSDCQVQSLEVERMELQTATNAAQAARIAADGKAQEAAATQRRLAQERHEVQVLHRAFMSLDGSPNEACHMWMCVCCM